MWIQHTATADPDSPVETTAIVHEEYTGGERVEFDPETGKARVTKDVGEQLCEHYESIVTVDDGDGDEEVRAASETDADGAASETDAEADSNA